MWNMKSYFCSTHQWNKYAWLFVFSVSNPSCCTERSTTAPSTSISTCPSRPSSCIATTSTRSPATCVNSPSHLPTPEIIWHPRSWFVVNPMLLILTMCFPFGLQLRYKEDLMWLRGLGCFMYDTPEMVNVRNITKFRVRMFFSLFFSSSQVVRRNLSLSFCFLFIWAVLLRQCILGVFAGQLSGGCQEEPQQLLRGPGHTRVQACDWAQEPHEYGESTKQYNTATDTCYLKVKIHVICL